MDTSTQKVSDPWLRLVFLLLWFALAWATYAFGKTPGFVWGWFGDRMVYAIETSNNGSDDAFNLQLGLLWATMALVWGAFRFRRRFESVDLFTQGSLLIVEGFFAFCFVDGRILETVTIDRNVPLAALLFAYSGLWAAWLFGAGLLNRRSRAVHRAPDAIAPVRLDASDVVKGR